MGLGQSREEAGGESKEANRGGPSLMVACRPGAWVGKHLPHTCDLEGMLSGALKQADAQVQQR